MLIKELDKQFLPGKGCLLIGEPFMLDPNFRRSVVLLCDYQEEEGSIGFVLNREMQLDTNEIVPELLDHNFPVFYGGPVETNSLHFIHKAGKHIEDAIQITKGIFWGGNIEEVNEVLKKGLAQPHDFRFFLGYSGWAAGQLEHEIAAKSWWTVPAAANKVFGDRTHDLWPELVKALGDDFSFFANSPEDYTWN